jgi:hypothetical protein
MRLGLALKVGAVAVVVVVELEGVVEVVEVVAAAVAGAPGNGRPASLGAIYNYIETV